jgi:hypothetical protein
MKYWICYHVSYFYRDSSFDQFRNAIIEEHPVDWMKKKTIQVAQGGWFEDVGDARASIINFALLNYKELP